MMMKRRMILSGGVFSAASLAMRGIALGQGEAVQPVMSGRGQAWRIMEDRAAPDGALTLHSSTGETIRLSRFMESYEAPAGAPYCGLSFPRLALAEADLLADTLLRGEDDPDEMAVRDAAPPVDSHFESEQVGRIVWTSFIGTPQADDVMPLTPAGNTRNWHVDRIAPELHAGAPLVAHRREGLLGGDLPIIVKQFQTSPGRYWEVMVFAETDTTEIHQVPSWQRVTLVSNGKVERVVYGTSYPPFGPFRPDPDESQFNAALLRCVFFWRKTQVGQMQIHLPRADWSDIATHGFVKELIVRRGGTGARYGVVDRDYAGPEYDGFQDIFTASLYANLVWGRFDQAKAILIDQFEHFVTPDGLVAMRGPEVGQTGLTLSLLALYARLSGDISVLKRYQSKIGAMAQVLVTLHNKALAVPASDPAHGLIAGWSESDACLFPDPSIWWKPYFSNSGLAARGLEDSATLWRALATGETARSDDWLKRAKQLRVRVNEALSSSIQHNQSPPYVPILPGVSESFRKSLLTHRYSEQQWAHRVYAELLQSGVLTPDLENQLINSMRAHGATVMGIVGNLAPPSAESRDMLGFISYGYALALLRQDRIREFILFLYAHRYHIHTRGSWTASEVAGLKGELALFCLPAQMTLPILLREALVHEDENGTTLHLARGVPRSWVWSESGIAVSDAPTQWGKINFTLRRRSDGSLLDMRVTAERALPDTIRLSLRLPKSRIPLSVTGNLPPHALVLSGSTLIVRSGDARTFQCEITLARG